MKLYQTKAVSESVNINILDAQALEEHACKGLLNLSVELGLMVFRQMMEEEAYEMAGPKGKHNTDRTTYRHGKEKTQIVLGGTKIQTDRIRVRGLDDNERPFRTLALFQDEDSLNKTLLTKLLCGVSTRKYDRSVEYSSEKAACTSKSEASRRFIKGMKALTEGFFARPLEGKYPVILIDGVYIGGLTVVTAMGIDSGGSKVILGIREGGTENSEVVKGLLTELIDRGLDVNEPRLYILDGSKALYKAVKDIFGDKALIQRCQIHKKRNVLEHLPKSEQTSISIAMANAYKEYDYKEAKAALMRVHRNLEHRYPKAADSLMEGLEETLTVHRLKIPGLLRLTLSNTNALESANSVCKGVVKRVSRYRNGADVIRHAAAGFMEAEKGFRRIRGYKQIPLLQGMLAKETGALNNPDEQVIA